jgi:hypothetical protein
MGEREERNKERKILEVKDKARVIGCDTASRVRVRVGEWWEWPLI